MNLLYLINYLILIEIYKKGKFTSDGQFFLLFFFKKKNIINSFLLYFSLLTKLYILNKEKLIDKLDEEKKRKKEIL